MATKAIIYTRFSPRKGADTCESCETQYAYCEQRAHDKGYEIGAVFHDKDVSGADEYREKLWQAIDTLGKGDVLLVYKRDRLARNVYLSEQINRAVAKMGGTIEAVSGDVDGEGDEQVLIRQVLASISEYERKLIGKRTKWAMLLHQKNGRRMSCHPPYGWRVSPTDPKKLEANPYEQEALELANRLHGEGKRVFQIVKELNDKMPDAARSGEWNRKAVTKMLKRPK